MSARRRGNRLTGEAEQQSDEVRRTPSHPSWKDDEATTDEEREER